MINRWHEQHLFSSLSPKIIHHASFLWPTNRKWKYVTLCTHLKKSCFIAHWIPILTVKFSYVTFDTCSLWKWGPMARLLPMPHHQASCDISNSVLLGGEFWHKTTHIYNPQYFFLAMYESGDKKHTNKESEFGRWRKIGGRTAPVIAYGGLSSFPNASCCSPPREGSSTPPEILFVVVASSHISLCTSLIRAAWASYMIVVTYVLPWWWIFGYETMN
jgi:hypothetical protein